MRFGDIFEPQVPSDICPRFQTVSRGRDFLAMEISALEGLYMKNGSSETQQQPTPAGMRWARSSHLCEPCPEAVISCTGMCKRGRIQRFVHKRDKGAANPGPLGDTGFAIFGEGSPHRVRGFSKKLTSSVAPSFNPRSISSQSVVETYRETRTLASPLTSRSKSFDSSTRDS